VQTLHQWIAEQTAKHCAFCGVALAVSVMTFGLMFAHMWGHP
jgi:hypothetical protein